MRYIYLLGTIFFTVYGQMILKWRISAHPIQPQDNKVHYLFRLFFDPYILSGFLAAFIASLFWMLTLTKFQLTKVYPAMSLAPILIFILGSVFFNEEITKGKLIGLLLIIIGSIISIKF